MPLEYGRLLMAFPLSVHSLFLIVGIGLALFISASELLDHAADGATECAALLEDNEARWRMYRERVERIAQPRKETPTVGG